MATLAESTAARIGRELGRLVTFGLASAVPVAQDGVTASVYGVDATEPGNAYAPEGAAVTSQGFTQTTSRRLFLASKTTTGAAWPFVPVMGAVATWQGRACAVLGVTPVQPGAVVLGYLLDVEA